MGLVVVLGSALYLSGSNLNIERSVIEKDGITEIVETSGDVINKNKIQKHIIMKKEGYAISYDEYSEGPGHIMETYEYNAKTNNSISAKAKYIKRDLESTILDFYFESFLDKNADSIVDVHKMWSKANDQIVIYTPQNPESGIILIDRDGNYHVKSTQLKPSQWYYDEFRKKLDVDSVHKMWAEKYGKK